MPKATKVGKTRAARRASLGKPRGRVAFLISDKVEFCTDLRSTWRDAVKGKTVGSFYNKSTNDFLLEFGYPPRPTSWKPADQPAEDTNGSDDEDEEDEEDTEQDGHVIQGAGSSNRPSRVSAADREGELEAAWKSKHRAFVWKTLGMWFRNNGNGGNRVKAASALGKQLDSITDMAPVKPRRQHEDQYFSTKYYEPMVKTLFDSHFQLVSSTWHASQSNSDPSDSRALPSEEDISPLAAVTFEDDALFAKIYEDWLRDFRTRGIRLCEVKLRAAYTRAVYRAQPAEFQRRLKQEVDDAYDMDMENYRKLVDAANEEKMPEQYDRIWSNAVYVIHPFAEHLSKKFGACMSILLTAPVGANRGAIGMKSVHIGTTSDARSLKWHDADSDGFNAMEASFCGFGGQCFTAEERAARAIQTVAAASGADAMSEQDSLSVGSTTRVGSTRQPSASVSASASPSPPPPLRQTPQPSSPLFSPSSLSPPRQSYSPTTLHPPQQPGVYSPQHAATSTRPQEPFHETPLFLPGSSSASAHSASGPMNGGRRQALPSRTTRNASLSTSQPAALPSRAFSQPSARAAPSHPAGSKRVLSTPTAGSVVERSRQQMSHCIPIDPALTEGQASPTYYYRQRSLSPAIRTPPLSPLIPENEPLVALRFSPPGFMLGQNGEMQPVRPPYARRPYISNGNEAAGELDELAWNMLEDKRQREWDGVDGSPPPRPRRARLSQRDRRLNGPGSDNPFAAMLSSVPRTPARPSGAAMPSSPTSPLRSLFTQRFQDAPSSPAPSPPQSVLPMRPPPSNSWPPSQPPPNAHQMMIEAGRRVRPMHAVSQPAAGTSSSASGTSGFQDDFGAWPEKMQELYNFFTRGKEWGAGWTACVNEWVEVQRMDQFQVDAKTRHRVGEFSSTQRPELIGTWIQYKRLPKDREVTDLVAYSAKWWAWWGLCQPEERSVSQNGQPGMLVEGLDWACMDVTSSCGLVLIMVSLSFWGAQIFKPGGASSRYTKDWHDAVSQVMEALVALRGWKHATAGETGKRKSATQPSSSSRLTKRRKA